MTNKVNFENEDECKDEIMKIRTVKLRSSSNSSNSSNSRNSSNSISLSSNKKDNNKRIIDRKSQSKSRSISPKPNSSRKVFIRNNGRIPEPCECIGVFGLSKFTTRDKLFEIFEKFGEIVLLNLLMDKNRNVSAGFGFVTYKTIEIATKAKNECNRMNIDGKCIRVDYSIAKKAYSPTPGVYKGKVLSVRNTSFRNNRSDEREARHRDRDNGWDRRNYSYTRDTYRNHRFHREFESRYRNRSKERNVTPEKYKSGIDTKYRFRKVDKYDHRDEKQYKYKDLNDDYNRKHDKPIERTSNPRSGDIRDNRVKRKYSKSKSPVSRKYKRRD